MPSAFPKLITELRAIYLAAAVKAKESETISAAVRQLIADAGISHQTAWNLLNNQARSIRNSTLLKLANASKIKKAGISSDRLAKQLQY